MSEGYVYIAGAMSMDGWLQFSGIMMADGGFVAQQVEQMMREKR